MENDSPIKTLLFFLIALLVGANTVWAGPSKPKNCFEKLVSVMSYQDAASSKRARTSPALASLIDFYKVAGGADSNLAKVMTVEGIQLGLLAKVHGTETEINFWSLSDQKLYDYFVLGDVVKSLDFVKSEDAFLISSLTAQNDGSGVISVIEVGSHKIRSHIRIPGPVDSIHFVGAPSVNRIFVAAFNVKEQRVYMADLIKRKVESLVLKKEIFPMMTRLFPDYLTVGENRFQIYRDNQNIYFAIDQRDKGRDPIPLAEVPATILTPVSNI